MSLSEELEEYGKNVSTWLDQAKRQTAVLQRLEKAVATGNLRDLDRLRQLALSAAQATTQAAEECPAFAFDVEGYLGDHGAFLAELQEAAQQAGVSLSVRDGNVFSYPVVVTREPQMSAVRIDKRLTPTIRPETLAALLKQLQSKDPKSRPQQFVDALFDAYEFVRAKRKIPDYIDIPLFRLYEVLTLLPGTDYTLLDFTRDLNFLDTSGITGTRSGYLHSLTYSTGSHQRSVRVLPFVTRDGFVKDFASIRFTPPVKEAASDD